MPAQSKTTASKKMTVKVVKPFCKVCHDAGKPENEYTSHFVRSDTGPNSKVICPTLLAQECRYCCKNGHTVKFCPLLTDQKKTDAKIVKKDAFLEAQDKKPVTKKHKKKQNAYEVLEFESDSEKEEVKITPINDCRVEEKPKKEEFPALCSSKKIAEPVLTGYANIAAKSKSQFDAEQQQLVVEKYEKELIERSIKGAKQVAKKEVPVVKKSWADWSDSDFEDDDDDERVVLSRQAPWVNYNRIAEIEDATW